MYEKLSFARFQTFSLLFKYIFWSFFSTSMVPWVMTKFHENRSCLFPKKYILWDKCLPPSCRRHPTVWPLFTCQFFWVGISSSSSHWLNPRVDVLEPALSQYRQDTIHLAWYEAQSCQERNRSALQSTFVPDWTNIREESWLHYRSRVKHEGPYHQTLPVVLLPASSNTHGSTLTYIISHPNFGLCLHLHASRFLQQPSLWDKCLPPWPSPIGLKFGCMFDPQNWQIWSDLGCNSEWPSLAPGFHFVFDTSSTPSQATAWLAVHRSTWLSYATLWRTFLECLECWNPARRNLWSSSQVQLLVPRYRKERSGRRGFSVSSPQLWNLLPADIRLLHNEHQLFRKRLKTHHMQQSMLCHWGSMSTVWTLLLLLLQGFP